MLFSVLSDRTLCKSSPMLYGQFLEHFHRQIYGGIYMPGHPLADENGFRMDVVDALRQIHPSVIRWPGGCFVSSYHWEKGVGPRRVSCFDKAWRVEDDNSFGTDEFVKFCNLVGCEPYICTNAGTGTEEEMSNWVEYCNLSHEGEYARQRRLNGFEAPHGVKYWSIGNENYGFWEIGAKEANEWGCLVREAAKMMKHVDPRIQLSAAALPDVHWNTSLLERAGQLLDWISIHSYWDFMPEVHEPADYRACMAYTADLDAPLNKVRGLLMAFGLDKKIKVAYDEWNLRSWHHPNVHTLKQGTDPDDYIKPRDKNDRNETYTMADAVFSACFLNMLLRNADLVGMANFAPAVNTRGAIYTYDQGIVLRPTYYVFYLYTHLMGNEVLDAFTNDSSDWNVLNKEKKSVTINAVDFIATRNSKNGKTILSAVNKHDENTQTITVKLPIQAKPVKVTTLAGNMANDFNDIDRHNTIPYDNSNSVIERSAESLTMVLPAHSVNIVEIG